MDFDPDVLKLFEIMRQSGSKPLNEMPMPEARETYRQMSDTLGGPAPDMAEITAHAADGPAGPVPLRLYRPRNLAGGPAPTLVYMHGGGWIIGDLESHDKVCRQLADRAECLVVAVDYRLAPEHPAPAGPEDVIASVAWIAGHASMLGIDPARLAVGGDSAGGSLAAVAAIAARDAGIPLRCQVLIYPSTDTRQGADAYPSRARNAQVPPLTPELMQFMVERYVLNEAAAQDWRASPIVARSLAGLPPALLITGSRDPLHDEGVLYAQRLTEAGVEVTHRNFAGMIHGFIQMAGFLSAADEAMETIGLILRQRLLPEATRFAGE